MDMKYGYIRVSTKDQNPDRQLLAMKENGVEEKNIYVDYMSGKDFERPQYRHMLAHLKPRDLIIVKSIDRLGRNYEEILEQWRILTKEMQVDIQVLDMPLLNTQIKMGDLTVIFISDLVLQILAYVSETERVFIRQRQAEGIAVAKSKGVHFGCKRIELENEADEVFRLYERKELSASDAAARLHISKSTFYRRYKEIEK
jgi:DNA invertase Pin-like site-specific DNA recombinase